MGTYIRLLHQVLLWLGLRRSGVGVSVYGCNTTREFCAPNPEAQTFSRNQEPRLAVSELRERKPSADGKGPSNNTNISIPNPISLKAPGEKVL